VIGLAAAGFAGGRLGLAETVHAEIRRLARNAALRWKFTGSTAAECRAWQEKFRTKLGELLGPHTPPAEWETEVEDMAELDDHRREALLLKAEGYPTLPVYRLTPKGAAAGKRAGIVALHGHGKFGNDSVVGIATTPERKEAIKESNYDYGLQLVRRGYVVTAPCFAPFGRRMGDRSKYGGDDPCAVAFVRLQMLGRVLMGENLRDALWALALLEKTKGVDGKRLGCVGLSYGGRMTMLATAMDERIRVAVASGALNVMQERILQRYSCGAQVIPGLLEYGDVPEIASLIAPLPCVWEIGERDPLMVKDQIGPALARIRAAYRAYGAEDKLYVDRFDGHHRWNGKVAYRVLAEALRSA